MNRLNKRGYTFIEGLLLLTVLGILAGIGGFVWICIHFIGKYW